MRPGAIKVRTACSEALLFVMEVYDTCQQAWLFALRRNTVGHYDRLALEFSDYLMH